MVRDTLKNIEKAINEEWNCSMPTTPNDDLFADLDEVKETNFKTNLTDFIADADKAIEVEKNQLRASKLWGKHLGKHFPEGIDEDVDIKQDQLNVLKSAILSGTAKTSSTGQIQNVSGVQNLPHRNFGGE